MKRAQGSVIPYVAVLLVVLVLSVQYVYSAYKLSNESTRLQNTADAAAYSAAVAAAQGYNFMALSNRAMVANQITIAQLTTMMSWMRMLRTFSGTINSIAQYIPYVGQISSAIDYWINVAQEAVEIAMPGLQEAVNAYLYDLSIKQRSYQLISDRFRSVDLMQEVVERNDPDVDYSFATLSLMSTVAHASHTRSDCQSEAEAAESDGGESRGASSDDAHFRCRQFRNVMLASKDGFTKDRLYDLMSPPTIPYIPLVAAGRAPSRGGSWRPQWRPWQTALTLVRAGGTTMAGTSEATPFGTWTALDTISIHGSTEWVRAGSSPRTVNYGELIKMGAGSAISGDEACGQCHFMHEGTAYWNANPRASICTDPWHENDRHRDDPETITNAALDFLSTGELSCSELRDEYQEEISGGMYGGLQPFADVRERGLVQDRDRLMIYLRKNRQDLKAYSATDFGAGATRETRLDRHEGAVSDSLHAAAAAIVTFRRDNDRLMLNGSRRADGRIEFGNSYNPFWEARLDPLTAQEKASVTALKSSGG